MTQPNTQKDGSPKKLAVQMLKRIYADLETKDMPEDQFVRESLGALQNAKQKKNSPIIQPN